MLIDGEATVEIDVRASYLTIFHAMHDIHLALENDPYEIAGLPRWLVKHWMVIAFGAGKPPIRWTSKAIEEFRESTGEKLGKVYNLRRDVTPKIMAAFPFLQKLKIGGYDCFDLMNRESNAMVASILRLLRTSKVPAYSIHDCLIVRMRDEELATSVLKDEYFKATKAIPYLKVS